MVEKIVEISDNFFFQLIKVPKGEQIHQQRNKDNKCNIAVFAKHEDEFLHSIQRFFRQSCNPP